MLKVKLTKDDAKLPQKAFLGDAGFDVFTIESKTLNPLERYKFNLGLCVEFPTEHVLMVCDKSGIAVNQGLTTIANVIDSTYRGEIHVVIVNVSEHVVSVKKGQKIAQIVLLNCYTGTEVIKVESLPETLRGGSGFGSTGLY